MSFSDKKISTHDVVNQRRETHPSGDIDADSNLSTWPMTGIGGGGGGGSNGSQLVANQNKVEFRQKNASDPSTSASLPSLSTNGSSASPSQINKQISTSSTASTGKNLQTTASNEVARQPVYQGVGSTPQYPYRSAWNSLPMTARTFEPTIGNHGYPSYFGPESILNQMYRGTSGSLNLVSMGLQSVSNFTGILNEFFMAIQNTLASLMNLTSQMHFIKDQFARAMSIFSLYRGLKWLITRLQHTLGLKTENDVEHAWREASSHFQAPAHSEWRARGGTEPSGRPWRKAFLTMLFITVPTLIIYILDVLNTPVVPPPRPPPDGRGSSQAPPDSSGTNEPSQAPESTAGQWPPSSGMAPRYSYPSFSPYRYGASNPYNNSIQFNSSYGFNSPFSSSTLPYTGTANPYSYMGSYGSNMVGGWGSFGSPNFNNAYGSYNGMYNRYNYGSNFASTEPFSNSPMYPAQPGYAVNANRPQASVSSQLNSFTAPKSASKPQSSSHVTQNSGSSTQPPAVQPSQ